MNLPVSEVFYSIQGEGMTTGVRSVFLRLGGCNLMCGGQGTQFDKELHNGATWRCDTIEVWMKASLQEFELILDGYIEKLQKGAHLVITGGEPMLQQDKIIEFIRYLDAQVKNLYVEIETNGTVMPSKEMIDRINQWNVSPKLSNSGNEKGIRFVRPVLDILVQLNSQFKFVVAHESDIQEVLDQYSFLGRKTWLMPAASDEDQLKSNSLSTAEAAKKYDFNFSTRMQIVLWNQVTGV